MSKSLGNSLFLKDLLDKYSPEVIKLALLQTNYRGDINITDNLFPDAEKHLTEFYKILLAVKNSGLTAEGGNEQIDAEFNSAMDDDFNTALAISNLFGYFKKIKSKLNLGDATAVSDANQISKTYSILGLFKTDAEEFLKNSVKEEQVPERVKAIAEERFNARLNKDWAKSDQLREELTLLGYAVKDAKDGYTLSKI